MSALRLLSLSISVHYKNDFKRVSTSFLSHGFRNKDLNKISLDMMLYSKNFEKRLLFLININ